MYGEKFVCAKIVESSVISSNLGHNILLNSLLIIIIVMYWTLYILFV